MPTYEYHCSKCSEHFERFQSMSAEPFIDCPACGEKKIQRAISGGQGIIFKGSGFYVTDYKKDKKNLDSPSVAAKEKTPLESKATASAAVKEKKPSESKTTPSTVKATG